MRRDLLCILVFWCWAATTAWAADTVVLNLDTKHRGRPGRLSRRTCAFVQQHQLVDNRYCFFGDLDRSNAAVADLRLSCSGVRQQQQYQRA